MVFNLAMALWQSRRLHRYEKAATHRQIEEASGYVLGDGDAMALLLERGVESWAPGRTQRAASLSDRCS